MIIIHITYMAEGDCGEYIENTSRIRDFRHVSSLHLKNTKITNFRSVP